MIIYPTTKLGLYTEYAMAMFFVGFMTFMMDPYAARRWADEACVMRDLINGKA